MKTEKAIEILQGAIEKMDARPYLTGGEMNVSLAMSGAIEALEYRTKMKAIPDKRYGFANCPMCGVPLNPDNLNNYCDNCGQALDLSEVEE